MRYLLISTAILLAGPALAERIETSARVTDVTVYPWGAGTLREVNLDLPAGSHELVIPGLPAGLDPAHLQVEGEGATIGAVSLQQERALPETPEKPPELIAAEREVNRLKTVLGERDAGTASLKARGVAAADMIDFLMKLAGSDGAGGQDIAALAGTVGPLLMEARETMVRAETEAAEAELGREELAAELDRAEARLAALRGPDAEHSTLIVAVQGQGQPARIRIAALADNASWAPVYEFDLDRKAATLRMDRGLMVTQNTGEDWRGVHLTLSTAQPASQSAPSELMPEFLRALEPESKAYSRSMGAAEMAVTDQMRAYPEAEPVAAPIVAPSAVAGWLGETVVYDYPTPVDLRHGSDALRLPLDTHQLTPEITAEAVPRRDQNAYLVADTVNTTGAVILPGSASFYADGALVGQSGIELVAAGDDMKLGFGPLTGIKLERRLPDESEGDRGLIVKSSERQETAILKIRNLTGEEWPLRIIDQVPVSRQEDLRIDWSADPAPDEIDPDGKRGLLVWNGKIAAGEERDITMTTKLRWPDGAVLIPDN